ncbi:MAG: hypothetical protein JHC95_01060 [Solirubrobacteraceae bacterium]|nr:hypothetical protein [Solirubrobacteraceae bacterium]
MISSTPRTGPVAAPVSTDRPPTIAPLVGASHGTSSERGRERTPQSSTDQGRFGRLFRTAPVFEVPRNELLELGSRMVAADTPDVPDGQIDACENPAIPAGYTYLGQFLDHDLTFDPVSDLDRQRDPDALHSLRTPRLDLDSLYGRGPADQPFLYQDDDHAKLRLGARVHASDPVLAGPDVPRIGNVALIGDPRNDENLIVSQLHSIFLRFHNAVVDEVRDDGFAEADVLEEAQRRVRWHYQWVILNDFLPRICGEDVMHDILHREEFVVTTGWSPDPAPLDPADPGHPVSSTTEVIRPRLRFYHYNDQPFLPLEFSVAAYRFGHSMVRQSYFINDFVRQQTGGRRIPLFNEDANPLANLNGGRPLPDSWGFDWKFFFRTSGEPNRPQSSNRMDDRLVTPLGRLQGTNGTAIMRSLAVRNLLRGQQLGLPSGQAVARAMAIDPLPVSKLGLEALPALERHTPLWYYVLREAGELCQGCCLGPVGGRIVAETIVGLVCGDPLSYLRTEPAWIPTLPFAGDTFRMADLISVAQGS